MGDYLWHYTGAKEAFLSQTDDGRAQVIGTNGRVLYTAPSKDRARKWAKEHGYRVTE